MLSKKVVITYPSGLHARPLSRFMVLIKSFKSHVTLVTPKGEVDCRSIVNLLTAAIKQGTEVEVQVSGSDEEVALEKIVDFLENLSE
ncbi:MAG: HPr family phosphocarrier protein [Deltaproteobacteria bacterium]|jgi:phosphotransferase system HPr (HPr) family protein|nr:HPr family phosphocarrier protein [Deltaproteobacteria bacterium]